MLMYDSFRLYFCFRQLRMYLYFALAATLLHSLHPQSFVSLTLPAQAISAYLLDEL